MPGSTKSTKMSDMEWHFIGKPRLRLIGLPLLVHLSRFQLHLGFQNHQSACGVSNTEDLAACCKMLPILGENTGSRKEQVTKSKFSQFLKHLPTWIWWIWMLSSSLSPLKSDMAKCDKMRQKHQAELCKKFKKTPSRSVTSVTVRTGVRSGDGTKDCFKWRELFCNVVNVKTVRSIRRNTFFKDVLQIRFETDFLRYTRRTLRAFYGMRMQTCATAKKHQTWSNFLNILQ